MFVWCVMWMHGNTYVMLFSVIGESFVGAKHCVRLFADFEIPSVESEWVVIGGVGRGIHHHWWVRTEQCVHTGKCVYMFICRYFVGSPLLSSLYLVPTQ